MQKNYIKSYADYDPIPYWKKVESSVFIAFGDDDTNLPVEKSVQRLKSNNLEYYVKVYPNGGHAIRDSSTNYVSDEFLKDLVSFIKSNRSFEINKSDLHLDAKGKLGAIDCLPEQREIDACIEIYQPVCGQMQVECITEPCNPVKETFENSCKACDNERVISYTEGECETQEDIKR
jgi:hypothetical protein